MSKRDLKNYLKELKKAQLEEQILDLYTRFKDVKLYYDFAFNPNEKKLLDECKFRISKEYFPPNGRKAKKRRSIAQKFIKQYKQLGVHPELIIDIMLYNIEIAQTYTLEYPINQDSFYISMLKSFQDALNYIHEHGLRSQYNKRIKGITEEAWNQNWFNRNAFEAYSN